MAANNRAKKQSKSRKKKGLTTHKNITPSIRDMLVEELDSLDFIETLIMNRRFAGKDSHRVSRALLDLAAIKGRYSVLIEGDDNPVVA